jgi:dTDP-glucose 4,6-dehydratase
MRILITGGLGFIGSRLVERLVELNHSVCIIDALTYAGRIENLSHQTRDRIKLKVIDVSDIKKLEKYFNKSGEFDLVVNLAAESHVDRSISSATRFAQTNLVGTVNLLNFYRLGAFKRYIQISTDEVYGTISEGSWDEDQALRPRSPYSASKASADLFCEAFSQTYGLSIVVTRCANNFGPYQALEKLIPKAIHSINTNTSVKLYGDGLNIREWIYVDDNINAILKLVTDKLYGSEVYNIGGLPLTNLELVNQLFNLMNKPAKIEFIEDRLGHDRRYSINDSKFCTRFGEPMTTDFTESLKRTVNWYANNSKWVAQSLKRLTL